MSIEIIRLGSGSVMIAIEGATSWKGFTQLVQNGSGLYPDLPAEIKTFADEVTVGKALQDYSREKPTKVTVEEIEEAFSTSDSRHCPVCDRLCRQQDTICFDCLAPLPVL